MSVPLARWVGDRLREPGTYDSSEDLRLGKEGRVADGGVKADLDGVARVAVGISKWPKNEPRPRMREFLRHPVTPLSERATEGFVSRTKRSTLRFDPHFIDALDAHLKALRKPKAR